MWYIQNLEIPYIGVEKKDISLYINYTIRLDNSKTLEKIERKA